MGLIGNKILKNAMEKSIPELKAEFVCMCLREKNSHSKRILNLQNFLLKLPFFPYFRDLPENGKGNKQRRRRKYMRKSY